MSKTKWVLLGVGATILLIVIVGLGVLLGAKLNSPKSPLGSVAVGNEYHYNNFLASSTKDTIINTGNGTLGSVVLVSALDSSLTLYDATTTNRNLRTTVSTTSLKQFLFPASTAAGTYTFDTVIFDGLIAVWGTAPSTSTITWR